MLAVALGTAVAHIDRCRLQGCRDACLVDLVAVHELHDIALAWDEAIHIGLDLLRRALALAIHIDFPAEECVVESAVIKLDHGSTGTAPDCLDIHAYPSPIERTPGQKGIQGPH